MRIWDSEKSTVSANLFADYFANGE